jgi:hypothetical protein
LAHWIAKKSKKPHAIRGASRSASVPLQSGCTFTDANFGRVKFNMTQHSNTFNSASITVLAPLMPILSSSG